jgi:cytoplasmic iron level regulating protein YaaA (DUF328/UPF0246 family)
MLILLPPSEGKTAPAQGEPLDLAQLAFPQLNKTRERLLAVLERLGPSPRALKYLDIGPGLAEEAARNATLRAAPAAPACEVYSGVLYEHLGLGSFDAVENVLIASALWGFVRPGDRIPAYRLSMGATLPRIPSLPALWRDPLRKALPDEGLIVDMRSGSYVAAFKPKAATVVGVRAFHGGKTISRPHPAHAARREQPAGGRRTRARGRPRGRAQRLRPRLDGRRTDIKAPPARADNGGVRQRRHPEG